MKRVTVIRALILAAVLIAMVLPFAASAQGMPPVAVRGYVKGDCGDKGVIGAVVEIYNLQTGQLKGKSVTASEYGDWVISLSGTVGNYRIVVTLPQDSGAQVVEWAYGAGDAQQTIAGPVNQVIWQYGPNTPIQGNVRYPTTVFYGPVTIFTDEPCTSPEANGEVFVWGKVTVTNPCVAPNPNPLLPVGPWAGKVVQLWRDSTGGRIIISQKLTNVAGMFGFGITAVTGKWYIVVPIAAGPPVVTYEQSFTLSASPGKGPTKNVNVNIPSPCGP